MRLAGQLVVSGRVCLAASVVATGGLACAWFVLTGAPDDAEELYAGGWSRYGVAWALGLGLASVCLSIGAIVAWGWFGAHQLGSLVLRWPQEVRAIEEGGDRIWIGGSDRRDEIGVVARIFSRHALKVREAHLSRAEVEQQARTDDLTNLPNRRGLFDYIEDIENRGRAGKGGDPMGVMHVDLDHFKAINDSLGHDAGDFVLREAALRMASVIRGGDLLARVGGDEFVIIVQNVANTAALEVMGNRIVARLSAPFRYGAENCLVGASVGAVLASGSQERPASLRRALLEADEALSRAKEFGRGRCVLYDSDLAAEMQAREERAAEIRAALIHGEFQPWFQPMIDIRSGAVTGLELLSRWVHPERGLLPPGEFLAAAEAHNMIEEVCLDVLERGCGVLKRLRANGVVLPVFHINVTRAQLIAPAVVEKLTWILDDANIPLEQVAMEVEEDSLQGRGADLVHANIRRFVDLGISPVLDDFGSGEAAIRPLTRLGALKIKSSRTLLVEAEQGAAGQEATEILRGMAGLGQGLGIVVVPKGVESTAQIAALREMGFFEMQGEALAPAMDEDALTAWFAQDPLVEGRRAAAG